MKSNNFLKNLIIIADDFTGANDTGVQFVKQGYRVFVNANYKHARKVKDSILVVNTESRLIDKNIAKEKITQTIKRLKNEKSVFYKKIDSTFRGNIGIEIEAMMNELSYNICILANAFPELGRTVENGICYLNGTPLNETDFKNDPINPITTASIKEVLEKQTLFPSQIITVEDIYSSDFENTFLDYLENNKKMIFICDSLTNCDLLAIAKIVYKYLDRVICVGCAGFANSLSAIKSFIPICFVSGSLSKNSINQINKIIENENSSLINIDKELFFSSQQDKIYKSIETQVIQASNNKKNIVISLSYSESDRSENDFYAEKNGILKNEIAKYIAENTAKIIKHILCSITIRALFISGGYTAINIMEILECSEVTLLGEIEKGVPYGILNNGLYPSLLISTKAGGFGDENTLLKISTFYNKG